MRKRQTIGPRFGNDLEGVLQRVDALAGKREEKGIQGRSFSEECLVFFC